MAVVILSTTVPSTKTSVSSVYKYGRGMLHNWAPETFRAKESKGKPSEQNLDKGMLVLADRDATALYLELQCHFLSVAGIDSD